MSLHRSAAAVIEPQTTCDVRDLQERAAKVHTKSRFTLSPDKLLRERRLVYGARVVSFKEAVDQRIVDAFDQVAPEFVPQRLEVEA